MIISRKKFPYLKQRSGNFAWLFPGFQQQIQRLTLGHLTSVIPPEVSRINR